MIVSIIGVLCASAGVSSLLIGLHAVYKASDIVTTLNTGVFRVYNGDNVNDTSGNSQNGTNVGGVTFAAGKVGNAFTFNGSNYINLPSASLNSLTGDFSVSWWMNLAGVTADSQFPVGTFYYDGTNFYGWNCYIQSAIFNFQIFNGTSNSLINTLATGIGPYYGTWVFFTMVRKGSTSSEIYINGALVASNSNTANPVYHASSTATIGARRFDSTVQYNMINGGKIDALTIDNKVLTASEITALYNGASGMEHPYSSAVTINSANDSLGAYNGTAVGGLTYTAGKSGNAFTFNGTNSYVLLPTNMFSTFTGDFSVNMWVNLQGVGADTQMLFSSFFYDGVNFYGYNVIVANSEIRFQVFNGTSLITTLAYGIGGDYNAWTMFTITRKASTRSRIYVNGTLGIADTSIINPTFHASTTPTIGARLYSGNLQYLMQNAGKIDEVTPYNSKEFTATEVTDLYNSSVGRFYPNF